MFDIKGKKALIIGAAGDLGFSMLEALIENGTQVVAIDVDESLKEISEKFKERNLNFDYIITDISQRNNIYKSFDEAIKILGGKIDILVNSAGIQRRYKSEEFPIEEWDKVISINLTAMFLYCQLAGKIMLESGVGKIIITTTNS